MPGVDIETATARRGITSLEYQIARVRRFIPFFAKITREVRCHLSRPSFSSTKTRVLWEIATREGSTAKSIGQQLQLDNGSLSRLLRSLEKHNLIRRERSPTDGRTNYLFLTDAGRTAYEPLDKRMHQQAEAFLFPLSEIDRVQLVQAMQTIERLLHCEQGKINDATPRAR